MNGATDLIKENNTTHTDSDAESDTNPDATAPPLQYYHPISAVDHDDDDESDQGNSDEEHHSYSYSRPEAENGISALHLNGDLEQKSSSEEEEEEETHDGAIIRAFREDDNRRNAPLSAENAMRVMEAMRGVSFSGSVPDWVGRVPEDQWVHQLRRLRQAQN